MKTQLRILYVVGMSYAAAFCIIGNYSHFDKYHPYIAKKVVIKLPL